MARAPVITLLENSASAPTMATVFGRGIIVFGEARRDLAQRRSGPILSRALPGVNGPLQLNKSEFSGLPRHF
jgi:hypothetical protein